MAGSPRKPTRLPLSLAIEESSHLNCSSLLVLLDRIAGFVLGEHLARSANLCPAFQSSVLASKRLETIGSIARFVSPHYLGQTVMYGKPNEIVTRSPDVPTECQTSLANASAALSERHGRTALLYQSM